MKCFNRQNKFTFQNTTAKQIQPLFGKKRTTLSKTSKTKNRCEDRKNITPKIIQNYTENYLRR